MKGSKRFPTTTTKTTTMYQSLAERTAEARKALKQEGINSRMVSLRTSSGSIRCEIKSPKVCQAMTDAHLDQYEVIHRCQATGEYLCGGNVFVFTTINKQTLESAAPELAVKIKAAIQRLQESGETRCWERVTDNWLISPDRGCRYELVNKVTDKRIFVDGDYTAEAAGHVYFSEMDAAYKAHRANGGSFADFNFVGSWVSEEAQPEPQAQEEAQPEAVLIEEPKAVYGTQLTTKKTEPINFPVKTVSNSADSQRCCRMFFHEDIAIYESFFILMLNRVNNPIGWAKISQGGQSQTTVDAKILAKLAVDGLAANVVLCHNHPSGRTMPSQADIEMTKKIKGGLALLDIGVLDHIILTEESYYSFADEGRI